MKLVAIYIRDEHFLLDKPQTLNFGGKYIYTFDEKDGKIILEKDENENYIKDFFDIAKPESESRVKLLSAIVGSNGSGKTSLMKIIHESFSHQNKRFGHINNVLIFEDDAGKSYRLPSSPKIFENEKENDGLTEIKIIDNKVQSLYYSPHFDNNINYNKGTMQEMEYDLSLDEILEKDLLEFEDSKINGANGFSFSPLEELAFKSLHRQLLFVGSSVVKQNDIFHKTFGLPKYGKGVLTFRRFGKKTLNNTPSSFGYYLDKTLKSIELKLDEWVSIRKFSKKNRVSNQLDVNKHLFKYIFLKYYIYYLIYIMEDSNMFLEKGKVPSYNEMEPFESIFYFLENAKILSKRAFDSGVHIKFINEVLNVLENRQEASAVSNTTLSLEIDDIISIIFKQKAFLEDVNTYFLALKEEDEEIYDTKSNLKGFISFFPSDRVLSSGENAMLNLFSRVFSFIETNLKNVKRLKSNDHYIVLFDEADLGFHPIWKKKYVKAILETLPLLFSEIKPKPPSIQIIFTTHDPLTLSDVPLKNTSFVNKNEKTNKAEVLSVLSKEYPQYTFGENIHEILAENFFLEGGLIGDFAKEKINETLNILNEVIENPKTLSDYKSKQKEISTIINMTGEELLRNKMLEMYTLAFKDNDEIDSLINSLEHRLADLKSKRNK